MKTIKLGLIGFGYIGKIHTLGYQNIPICISKPAAAVGLAALLRSQLETDAKAVQAAGFEVVTTDPDQFYAPGLDAVDICTPNDLHLEQGRRALEEGCAVYCEKPLAKTLEEALFLAELAESKGSLTQVAFMMRYVPAIRQMKALIEAGEIGEVYHFRGRMFHGSYIDPNRPVSWRLSWARSGGGAFMDLGAHLVDLTHYLLGRVSSLRAQMNTFIHERPSETISGQKEIVDVDDWAQCNLELQNGARGSLEVTRLAAGARQDYGFEVYGSKGALVYTENSPDAVRYYSIARGEWIEGPKKTPPAAGERPIEQLWPNSKFTLGWFLNAHLASEYDFLLDIAEKKPSQADFRAGAYAQEVVEAAYQSAARGGEKISNFG